MAEGVNGWAKTELLAVDEHLLATDRHSHRLSADTVINARAYSSRVLNIHTHTYTQKSERACLKNFVALSLACIMK